MAKGNGDKRTVVKQKEYLGLIAPQLAIEAWGNDKSMLQTVDPKCKGEQGSRMKVKQKDLMILMNMKCDKDSQDRKNKSLVKSTKERREIFIDGYQLGNQDLDKRMVFSGSDMSPKQSKGKRDTEIRTNLSDEVKRFHVSKESHNPPKHGRRRGRRRLYEENPNDLGGILHDKLKNWSPHLGSSLKGKLSAIGTTSKSYDLHKGKGNETFSESLRSKDSSATASSEIYISLEKKSLQEKKDCIKHSKAKLVNDYVELSSSPVDENIEIPEDM